ncbi:MAG: tRNA (N6-isopentenyl adenosine(37)-C2)-methylthiotransferase MiaB [Nitrospinae bacterium]|nr:tRNA (N6-isopentenyl adenosine(37)-C2)-methylthiotransferase MiaB [Nitrospinota bacterium]
MKKKLAIITLGCQMNRSDSEWVSGLLADDYDYTDTVEGADVVVVNTCAVRDKAEQKFFSLMGRLGPMKSKNPQMTLCVGGCIAQELADGIVRRAPLVDVVFGTRAIDRFPTLLKTYQETGHRQIDVGESDDYDDYPMRRSSAVTGWISIMRGCDNRCSYCIVPTTRGAEQSRPMDTVVREAVELGERGYKEIWLLGQNVNSYGKGLVPTADFATLLARIDSESSIPWVRFMTSHPKDLSDRLIDAMGSLRSVTPALHLPIQSGADRILAAMDRGYTVQHYFNRVERLRRAVPDLSLTADVIVGFPGESDSEFEATLVALDRAQFDNIYLFKYSPRPGTPAATLPEAVDPDVAQRRFEIVQRRQKEITGQRLAARVGEETVILVDGPSRKDDHRYAGRTPQNITVNITSACDLTGQFVPVRIVASRQFSLEGESDTSGISERSSLALQGVRE